ncbi:MAG: DUF120 domain-containing protein [Thermoproteota archaeon]|nr:DUF120 domain-containing protein [Candidatus Brockarchaeota archaeon]MBO3763092.1 DUF120 domain-containing protein [Candidatus Brockarchaeota archaeon]MBO3768161.1 DUF120 domain-containing protein [Candidatus Brockarchaeota archaeon]MBO3800831.1 DUF120 domain-containing protein [Candidatus Brockarchaeota archaeon]
MLSEKKQPEAKSFSKKAKYLFFLINLVKISGKEDYVITSTNKLKDLLGLSQQSVSLILKELEKERLIEREIGKREEKIKITKEGFGFLVENIGFLRTQELLNKIKTRVIKIKGKIFTGKGEGAYYLSQKQYVRQIEDKLNFFPYPGTLNLKLSSYEDISKVEILYNKEGVKLNGFTSFERTFGDVFCYPAKIEKHEDVKCAIVRSERTSYNVSVVELISDVFLRKALDVKDGDEITIMFEI